MGTIVMYAWFLSCAIGLLFIIGSITGSTEKDLRRLLIGMGFIFMPVGILSILAMSLSPLVDKLLNRVNL
jgi:hypothetical protein